MNRIEVVYILYVYLVTECEVKRGIHKLFPKINIYGGTEIVSKS